MTRDNADDDFLRQLTNIHDYLHLPMASGRSGHAQIYF